MVDWQDQGMSKPAGFTAAPEDSRLQCYGESVGSWHVVTDSDGEVSQGAQSSQEESLAGFRPEITGTLLHYSLPRVVCASAVL